MIVVDKQQLRLVLRKAWSKETSASSKWDETNPALGQCAVTACVVQDYLGGDILNSVVTLSDETTVSHYFNIIDGVTEDFTKEQFPDGSVFTQGRPKTKGLSSTREYCLTFEDTKNRYDLLRSRVEELLNRLPQSQLEPLYFATIISNGTRKDHHSK